MEYMFIDQQNRQRVNAFISEHWFSTDIIVRGAKIDMTQVDGIVVLDGNNEIMGLLMYIILNGVCEIMSLDSLVEGRGIGTALINRVICIAKKSNCKRIVVITTNDNINAIRFYQKRGFDMVKLYHNALNTSRKMKPEIPLIGENDIPLRHEIEFEMDLVT